MAELTEAESDAAAERAAARVSFQLTYDRAQVQRVFTAGFLSGPSLPNAYGDDHVRQVGEWDDPDSGLRRLDEAGWVNQFASYAVNEAVHEALEWFRVDGVPWLDPHGPAEDAIYKAVDDLVRRLAAIRAEHGQD